MDWQRLSELMFVPPIACVVFPRACLRYFPLCEMYYNCLCVHWCILFEMVGYRQYCGFFGAGEELSTSGIRTSCAVHPLKMYSRCMIDNLWLIIILLLWRVPEFEASKYLVSNREFYEFVKDGGYQRKELWTEEGNTKNWHRVLKINIRVASKINFVAPELVVMQYYNSYAFHRTWSMLIWILSG